MTSHICINITSNTCMRITSDIYKINSTFPPPRGLPPGRGQTSSISVVCIRCNTHAYIRYNTDAYIMCPYTHAYIRCLAAAAASGNSGDCTAVLGTAPL